MKDNKVKITTDSGQCVEAQAPVIVLASRTTDIPAFYADWFFERLKKGYAVWKNPYSGAPVYVSFNKTRFIVFWSKNPAPLIKYYYCPLKVFERRAKIGADLRFGRSAHFGYL